MKAEKVVNVKAFHTDKEVDDLLGWATKPVMRYSADKHDWIPTGESEILFGRVDSHGYMTHMSYVLSTHRHTNWNEWLDQAVAHHNPPLDKWYFDAGSNGYPIYVEIDEMKRAMIELGLYKK